jgi:cytochrome c6
MKHTSNIQTRVGVLLSAVALLALASIPLMGMAQDATPTGGETDLLTEGEQIYNNVCIACHQPGGAGIEGVYPPLNNNPLIAGDDPTYLINTVLTGRGGMPTFGSIYSDEQIAAISTYVRQAWDNDAGPVDPEQVTERRQEIFETSPEQPPTQDEATTGTPEATPAATP